MYARTVVNAKGKEESSLYECANARAKASIECSAAWDDSFSLFNLCVCVDSKHLTISNPLEPFTLSV